MEPINFFFNLWLQLFSGTRFKYLSYYFNFINFYKSYSKYFLKISYNFKLELKLKSIFKFGLLRDVFKLNLFLYKFIFFWKFFKFSSIFCQNQLKITLLRSVFVNKTSRVQYLLQNYMCNYTIYVSTSWFLFYWLFLFKNFKILKYSKLLFNYIFSLKLKKHVESW